MGAAMARSVVILGVLVYFCCGERLLSSVDGDHFPTNKVKRCVRQKAYGMTASDCHGRDLHGVPTNLNSDIEVLDLSYNRIRELDSDSFSRYTSLKMVFLDENMINYIAEDAFEPVQYLDVALLNLNAISQVPKSLFSLPYLRKVDLSENRMAPTGLSAFSEVPLTNQLKWLSMSYCHLTTLPPLQRFVNLEYLNVTGNVLTELDVVDLAPLCSLKYLDLGTNHKLLRPCDCYLLGMWAERDGMTIYPPEAMDCLKTNDAGRLQCHSSNDTLQAKRLRSQCTKIVAEQQQKAHMSKVWMYAGITAAAVLGILLILIFWVVRRRRSRTLRTRRSMRNGSCNGKAVSDTSDTTLLPSNGVQNGAPNVGASEDLPMKPGLA